MIKLISKPISLPILLLLVKTNQRIVADPKRKLSPPFDSADSVPSLGHPAPGSGKMLSLFTVLCDYPIWVTETGAPGSGKTIQPIRIELCDSSCCPNHVPLGQVLKPFTVPSHALNASLLYTCTLLARCQRQVLRYYVIGLRM